MSGRAKRKRGSSATVAPSSASAASAAAPHQLIAKPEQLAAQQVALAELWHKGLLTDVNIAWTAGSSFRSPCGACKWGSEFFRALFTSGCRDSARETVTVHEIGDDEMESILTFLYEAKLSVQPTTLAAVMRAASRLEVSSLVTLSAEFLADALTLATCAASWNVAMSMDRPELDPLREACVRLAAVEFKEFAATPEFNQLSSAQLSALLAHDWLNAEEDEAFTALTAWLGHQHPPLVDAAKLELLAHIRYLRSAVFLASDVEETLKAIEGGQELLFEAYRHKALPVKSLLQMQSPRTSPRLSRVIPMGVQRNLPADFLSSWTKHFEGNYQGDSSTVGMLTSVPQEATHVFVGARRPDGTIALGACGERDEVLRRSSGPDFPSTAREHNGVYWYFHTDHGEDGVFGFSRVAAVSLETADTLGSGYPGFDSADEDGHYRMSWHIGSGDNGEGWRAGQMCDEELVDGWKKLVCWR